MINDHIQINMHSLSDRGFCDDLTRYFCRRAITDAVQKRKQDTNLFIIITSDFLLRAILKDRLVTRLSHPHYATINSLQQRSAVIG